MAELQFQRKVLNDQGDMIFWFHAITNEEDETVGKIVGEIIVNLTKKYFFVPEDVWTVLRNEIFETGCLTSKYENETKNMSLKEKEAFISLKCDEEVEKILFEECNEVEDCKKG